jgi:Mg2+ and Co2+ transporter CorA
MSDGFDHITFATLLGGAVALMKVLEKLIEWAAKKMNGKDSHATVVQLDPEVSRMLRETYERTAHVNELATKTDNDGIPMMYTPRSAIELQRQTAEALRDVTHSCERISKNVDSNSEKIDQILTAVKK